MNIYFTSQGCKFLFIKLRLKFRGMGGFYLKIFLNYHFLFVCRHCKGTSNDGEVHVVVEILEKALEGQYWKKFSNAKVSFYCLMKQGLNVCHCSIFLNMKGYSKIVVHMRKKYFVYSQN